MTKSAKPLPLSLLLLLLIITNSCSFSSRVKIVRAAQCTGDGGDEFGDNDNETRNNEEEKEQCKVWLVQSIPTDMPHLPLVPGVLSTGKKVVIISLPLCFSFFYIFVLKFNSLFFFNRVSNTRFLIFFSCG